MTREEALRDDEIKPLVIQFEKLFGKLNDYPEKQILENAVKDFGGKVKKDG